MAASSARRSSRLQIKVIMFDFGGVVVDWVGPAALNQLTRGKLDPEQARLFWLQSPSLKLLETGRCDAQAFARGVLAELNLPLAPDEFLEAFISWDRGVLPGAVEILEALKPRYTLACLSNNNLLHWSRPHLQNLLQHFQHRFVSFEIGLAKPDPAIFRHAIDALGLPPGQILFLDDNIECVHGAQAAGLQAAHAIGPAGIKRALAELGLI